MSARYAFLMFIGHFGVALAAKKLTPKTSLGTLFAASQLLDLIWPFAVVLGLESAAINPELPTYNALDLIHVPYSHSLGMALIWAVLFGVGVKRISASSQAAWVCAAVVFSHWVLDWVTHIPDLPLWFGSKKVGLGLWRSGLATFAVETLIFVWGIFLYRKTVGPIGKKQKVIFWSLIILLYSFFAMVAFGHKPEKNLSSTAVAAPGFALWLIVIWAAFADRKKTQLSQRRR